MSTLENPPAFPNEYGSGITYRDLVAILQLAGACANPLYKGEVTQDMADAAYRHADAMLHARARNRAGEEGRS